ncbi:MAG: M55 family metallopeptidase [Candidatus Aminicenantes bacterium]|nr:MAG: M55 family metallopeptidase [Candidatus Aminicenantes bacterium]
MRPKKFYWLTAIGIGTAILLIFYVVPGCKQAGPKVLIVIDMDGASGVTNFNDVLSYSPTYQAARESLTEDVNAAIRGLLKSGAREVVLTDAHGSGNPEPDYIVDRLPEGARFDIRDEVYDAYIDTLDETFDAVVCMGMHSRAGAKGQIAHTYYIHTKWIMAGFDMNESMLVAASAARFDIPLILVAGDDVLEQEIKEFSPRTEYVVVKKAVDFFKAVPRPQEQVSAEIEAAAERALRNLKDIPVWKPQELNEPFKNLFKYTLPVHATMAMDFPGAKEVDNKTVSITTESFLEAYLTFRLLSNYTAHITYRKMVEAVSNEEGGRDILKKAQAKLPDWKDRDFSPTGEKIDFSLAYARGKHGYK